MTLVNSMSSGVGRGPALSSTVMLAWGWPLVGMVGIVDRRSRAPCGWGVRLLLIAPLILQPLRVAGSAGA